MSRVFILSSGNIFRNLAFEVCLSKVNKTLKRSSAASQIRAYPSCDLLLWRSDPCVVIGRFQNTWQEVNTQLLRSKGWSLARRHSGGGAVFHDRDNLNISFIETKDNLDRAERMQMLQAILQPLCLEKSIHVGPRLDLWVSEPDQESCENASKTSTSSVRVIHVANNEEEKHVCADVFQQELRNLHSWSWTYGASPAFSIDLNEFESRLSEVGRFSVSCARGGLVTSVDGPPDSQIHQSGFMNHLSESLKGISCQTHFWDGVLDQIGAVWILNRPSGGQLTPDQQVLLSALKHISSRL